MSKIYPQSSFLPGQTLPATPKFADIEKAVLEYWKSDDTFPASIDNRDAGENGANEFVFYDGPPFANGLPHYGHLLTGYVKDVVPRYRTMRGERAERVFGWDTHGLPAELEAMRQLGLKTKQDIIDMGIDTFNDAARASVLRYTGEWEAYVQRMGRWVDFPGGYQTLNLSFMESVIWAFKTLHEKGLIYEGLRVLPYCWNDETPLSNHELRMDDDVYQQRQDPAVTVGLPLADGKVALIWTTTPWTLPANLAIAVHPEVDYVVVRSALPTGKEQDYVLAQARLAAYARELFGQPDPDEDVIAAAIVERCKGADLAGMHYTPPFSYYQDHDDAFRVLLGEYVTTEDGTGIVHQAPGFGEEDKALCDEAGIATVVPVGADGCFTAPVDEYAGLQVMEANPQVMAHLKARTRGENTAEAVGSTNAGIVLLRHDTYDHSYPHCWRCRKPLIYMAVSSWFVEVTKIKERMVELNQQITWVPENVKHGQFGKWLENARDWSITRNRFWGSPVPVWKSDNPRYPRLDVYGSVAELEHDFGVQVTDLHRPYIDELVRPNPDDPTGQSMMRRVPDVLDVWFDSGSMSFAQVHYPMENREWFEHHFPADFIVEYIGQTRGWFYTLHILATALFDKPAFSSVICHGIVLGDDGQKMSKSLRNYPDVNEVFERDGADAMRWFLMASPILRGGNLSVTEAGIREGVRQVMLPLWSAWYFFSLYANAEGYQAQKSTTSPNVMDRYILAKTQELIGQIREQMDDYDVAGACDTLRSAADVLTNWYIRRSRDRFWNVSSNSNGKDASKLASAETSVSSSTAAGFNTLYTVLETLCRAAAPLLPFVTEAIWRGLTGERSVHLADYPRPEELPADAALVAAMDQVREICSSASALRKAHGARVRLPLARVTIAVNNPQVLQEFAGLIAEEINVKEVTIVDVHGEAAAAAGVSEALTIFPRVAGPRLGRQVQEVIKAAKTGQWVQEQGRVTAGGIALEPGEFEIAMVVQTGQAGDQAAAMLPSGGFLVLDVSTTPALEAEGIARDVIRAVAQARRAANFEVSDRICLRLLADAQVLAAVKAHAQLISEETLTVDLHLQEGIVTDDDAQYSASDLGQGRSIGINVKVVS